MTASSPMEKLGDALRQNTLVRIIEQFGEEHPDSHLKDLVIDEAGPGREIVVLGRRVVNFGSDSFLGLDQDPRVQEAVRRGLAAVGDAQRLLAGLRQRPGQHRCRGEARRLAGRRVGPDLPVGDAGEPGGDPRPGRPAGRDRAGRAGAQLDAGGRQDRPGQRHEGGDLRAQRPGGPGADARRRCGRTAAPWSASTASTA